MAWSKKSSTQIKRSQIVLAVILLAILAVVSFVIWNSVYKSGVQVDTEDISVNELDGLSQDTTENNPDSPVYDAAALQTVVDNWVNALSGSASVVVMTPEQEVLAAHNADQVFFAASLYKLYVAYEGYRLLEEIDEDPNTAYLGAYTREECLDKMIRESHSPCAEKMWVELGKLELTNTLREYGITNTSMVGISTTAYDAAIILARIARGEGLTETTQASYLDSMREQDDLYRRGLPSGFSGSVTVYNKVGWNELVEWHDAAIVDLPAGNKVIVTVLTENVGTANVRELAGSLETVLVKE